MDTYTIQSFLQHYPIDKNNASQDNTDEIPESIGKSTTMFLRIRGNHTGVSAHRDHSKDPVYFDLVFEPVYLGIPSTCLPLIPAIAGMALFAYFGVLPRVNL